MGVPTPVVIASLEDPEPPKVFPPLDFDEKDGLCMEPEYPNYLFFPGPGQGGIAMHHYAVGVCSRCLVRPECLLWSLVQGGDLHGIFGGYSKDERKVIGAAINAGTLEVGRTAAQVAATVDEWWSARLEDSKADDTADGEARSLLDWATEEAGGGSDTVPGSAA